MLVGVVGRVRERGERERVGVTLDLGVRDR